MNSMAFGKSDLEILDSRIRNIIEQPVEQIEVTSDLPPTIKDLENNNKKRREQGFVAFPIKLLRGRV